MASLVSSFTRMSLTPSAFLAERPLGGARSSCLSFGETTGRHGVRVVAVKEIKGVVVKTVNDKTAAVEVSRIYAHPLYKKRIRTVKRYQVHDPENKCNVGDKVTLAKCAPVSKMKKFVVVSIQPPRVAGAAAAAAREAAQAVADAEAGIEQFLPFQSEVEQ